MSSEEEFVTLLHGGGGELMERLVKEVIVSAISRRRVGGGVGLDELCDGATIRVGNSHLVVSIDGHTIDPPFFPGGDIGRLAVAGTVNDVAVMGARPLAILDAIIVEEGFPISDLRKIVESMNATAEEAGVAIVAGDFKVMPHGKVDRITISTCGVGIVEEGSPVLDSGAKPGDKVIVSGPVGDHGIALLAAREGLSFETDLVSDVAPIWQAIEAALRVGGVHAMKDPTRGGLAYALNEIAEKSSVSIWLDEERIPVREAVRAASEMLGLDPLEVTCEGRVVMCVDAEVAEEVLKAVRRTKYGAEAEIVGEVREERPGYVLLRTSVGGTRIVEKPLGEPIPRVC